MTIHDLKSLPTLITGAAGFIGFHLAKRLLDGGWEVVGLDNLNDYYDPQLKRDRLAQLEGRDRFRFVKLDLADRPGMEQLFAGNSFGIVVNLAAQAGVRYSLTNPHSYVDSNMVGFLHVLEGCRHSAVKHLVYASSSSVYGANTSYPFAETDTVDHPVSLYAATKKANELMAHTYAHLYGLPCTGLRFFTVYGPWGRPDMAFFKFTKAILAGEPIDVYGHGRHAARLHLHRRHRRRRRPGDDHDSETRPWTGPVTTRALPRAPPRGGSTTSATTKPVELLRFIEVIEQALGRKAVLNMLPMQPGDVRATAADVDTLGAAVRLPP